MTATIIDGKQIAANLRAEIALTIQERRQLGIRPPGLAVILIGDDPASDIYVRNKREACGEVDIHSVYHHLPVSITETALLKLIATLNHDANIDGILIQLPLPAHINVDHVIQAIDPAKDVDGFHPYNLGLLAQSKPILRSCTPYGIMLLLEHIKQPFKQQHAVVVGASKIVGRPMALELLSAGCTVTICHRFSSPLEDYIRQADIVISAVGKPEIIKGHWIKPGACVIDVGIIRLENGQIVGDVEFAAARQNAAWITPVPGGVGPMTVAVLLKNTLTAQQNSAACK
jgi:methylenetetrahydrofolate dehydrogenase (NADP+)/methenyltetrahydrofolate cyclohydrolase